MKTLQIVLISLVIVGAIIGTWNYLKTQPPKPKPRICIDPLWSAGGVITWVCHMEGTYPGRGFTPESAYRNWYHIEHGTRS